MRARAQPLVNFNIRVPVETDNLRRQLQGETGLSGSELVTKGLASFGRRAAPRTRACRLKKRNGAPCREGRRSIPHGYSR
jgi:hypothetical protein